MLHQSTEDSHIFTLVLGHARLNFSKELSTEYNLVYPSSLVDDKEADAVLVSILGSDDSKQTSFIEDEGPESPADLLDEIFVDSDNSEKLDILMHCYKVLGLFSKIFEFKGSSQGDFIRVLSAAPSEARAIEHAYEVYDACFGYDDDDELEEQLAETATVPATKKRKAKAPTFDELAKTLRKKSALTEEDMAALVFRWHDTGKWPAHNESKMSAHLTDDRNPLNIRWKGPTRPILFNSRGDRLANSDITSYRIKGGMKYDIATLMRSDGIYSMPYLGQGAELPNMIGMIVAMYKPKNDAEFAAALGMFLQNEVKPGEVHDDN
jgi:hypothetical protein